MRTVLIILLLTGLSVPLFAQPRWEVASSKVTFVIRNAGLPVDGSFGSLRADLRFDPDDVQTAHMAASVDATTIKTGIRLRDNHLQGRGYFEVEQYPRITMRLVQARRAGEGFEGDFDVTIKEHTRRVTMPFTFQDRWLKGQFSLNRLDVAIGRSSPILADTVEIMIAVQVRPVSSAGDG